MYNKEVIQKKLATIGSNAFQKLCFDIIIYKYDKELLSIEATGSQIGKDNTIKGVPDIYFYLEDEKYVFIEVTIQQTGLKKKFIDDIKGCIKKNILLSEVSSIWLMFNTRIGQSIESQVRTAYRDYEFTIKFSSIDDITDDLMNFPFLLKDHLEISINAGYVLPLNYFVENYNKRENSLGTPIDNPFFNRKQELTEIQDNMKTEDILIIKGDSGVGKTKFAVEAIRNFCKENPIYKKYAINNSQSSEVINDLYTRILKEKNVILLIDDANHKENIIKEIINLYKDTDVKIKFILTVRQYAFPDIKAIFDKVEIIPFIYNISKFTREELSLIISNEPFFIGNQLIQDRILDIAKGNSRLAIMGAIAHNENPDKDIFSDILTLYDDYFRRTISELTSTIKEKTQIKVLGLIATFNTIKLEIDNEDTRKICEVFDFNFKELKDNIEELEKKELVEIHPKFNRAKINEQITYTYFFISSLLTKKYYLSIYY